MRAKLSRVLRALADRLEPPGRVVAQPRGAPLVRLGGRWWRPDDLEPVAVEEGTTTGDVHLLP